MNLWVVFLTGLTTGGLACLAVQGGLLASIIANQKRKDFRDSPDSPELASRSFDKGDWLPVVMFLGSKLVVHGILGFLLGALGSVFTLSFGVKIFFQVLAAAFMLTTALNLFNVHPIFRFVAFQPPKFIQRKVRQSSKASSFFAPTILGVFTVFIPCGVTQAMEVLAINSGNPITGALIMMVFVLGTAPIFGFIGIATAKLSESLQVKFLKFAALLLVGMSLYSFNGVLQAVDAPISWQRIQLAFSANGSASSNGEEVNFSSPDISIAEIQKVHIEVQDYGYKPNRIKVKAGVPVELTVETNDVYSCASAFTFRQFGIYALLEPTDSETFRFTPTKKGQYVFACSMGMYTGTFEVI
ncbi:MAG: sulfite exporter TauE/SafE family protein [bacterium]|nr:sulfite exporter TauE/SafE family protein [bacterium]